MRRLLAAVLTACLAVGLAVPALALAGNRLPSGITRVYLTISFPMTTGSGSHKPVHKTLSKAASVAEAVDATNALPIAKVHVMCPMIMRVGPELTVVFKNAHGNQVAAAQVQVTQGSKGDSGSSACFPIRFTSSGKISDLLGNSWVRTMGKLVGTSIS
jgi:hypothetical protein